MAIPRSAASIIPDHDDSVENEKDSGPPPPKKSKVEEDNSSVPISQDSDDIEAKTAFDRWCKLFLREYHDESEKEMRLQHFKNSFNRDVDPTRFECGFNAPQYADRSEEEYFFLTNGGAGLYCYIDNELLDDLEEYKSEI